MSNLKRKGFKVLVFNLISGTSGGIALTLSGHPLDTIKVRMQTQQAGNRMFKGPFDCLFKTVKNEGFFGLYKGVWSPVIGCGALFALAFASYGIGKRVIAKTDDASKMTLPQIYASGCCAGFFPVILVTPMERIKVLLQTQYNSAGAKKYNGVFDCARKIGFRGMYQGTMSTLYRDIPGSGFYYGTYEFFVRMFCSKGGRTRDELNSFHFLVAGGMAGIVCWFYMIFPDTIKSRIQVSEPGRYKNFIHAAKDTLQKEGLSFFLKGATPVLIRSFPANAACFVAYEYTMRALKHLDK